MPFAYRRGGAPGPFFLILGLRDPRGSVCLGFGGRFLRASRFSLFRFARSLMFFVFMVHIFRCRGAASSESFLVEEARGLNPFERGIPLNQFLPAVSWKTHGQFGLLALNLATEDCADAVLGMSHLHPEPPAALPGKATLGNAL